MSAMPNLRLSHTIWARRLDRMTTPTSTVAVLGLGRMGTAMTRRLTEQRWPVTTWTRSDGTDLGPVVQGADLVLLALFDGPACDQVLAECAPYLSAAHVVINTTTAAPHEAVAHEKAVQATGATYVHAPVMGSVPAVLSGTLKVLVGSSPADLGTAESLLADLGEVVRAGGVADAAALKLVANGALGGAVLAVRDSRRYAEELGVSPDTALDVLERSALGGLVQGKRDRPPAHFTAAALSKDLTLLAAETPAARTLADRVTGALVSGTVAEDDDLFALTAPSQEPAAPDDVLEPLQAYIRGHATGDPTHFRRAFLPTAHVEGLREGRFVSWTLDEYCALFGGTPAADEADRRRRIERVDVEGTVGTATMTLWHGPDTFTDVFLLIRVHDEWRIANKAYHRR
jgi:3-hydroxyisobutyrate dehydrogenase-like beta-hydroxyacid dehydrogenase